VVEAAAVTRCPWWRQPQWADVVLQASGAVEAKRSREINFFGRGARREPGAVECGSCVHPFERPHKSIADLIHRFF
jgi:hypothetical protein